MRWCVTPGSHHEPSISRLTCEVLALGRTQHVLPAREIPWVGSTSLLQLWVGMPSCSLSHFWKSGLVVVKTRQTSCTACVAQASWTLPLGFSQGFNSDAEETSSVLSPLCFSTIFHTTSLASLLPSPFLMPWALTLLQDITFLLCFLDRLLWSGQFLDSPSHSPSHFLVG